MQGNTLIDNPLDNHSLLTLFFIFSENGRSSKEETQAREADRRASNGARGKSKR